MENSNLVYGVKDRPNFGKVLVFALQQLLAILAATIAVPSIIGNGMSQSAALFGAGAGTLIYLLFTRFKSPVFLGSSFAFLGSMGAAFAGAVTVNAGFLGLIIGAILAGLVYVVLAMIIKACGTGWINKIMPAVVIGPTVALIGLSLAGNAVGDIMNSNYGFGPSNDGSGTLQWVNTACICIGLLTLFVTIICSVFGKKMLKMIPFIIGIAAGYLAATVVTAIGHFGHYDSLNLIHFEVFKNMKWYPDFAFINAFKSFKDFGDVGTFFSYLGTITLAYVPVAFVVFAEHIADHKNLSSIIDQDLLTDPGLDNTLLGDGIGSMVGAFFGGCPNTTYGESIGCVAISGNASVITIFVTACMAIVASFFAPFTTLLSTIPGCVMGGVCIALYGFIAVSGLKMIQNVDLGDNRNLFVVSVILICGVGGLTLNVLVGTSIFGGVLFYKTVKLTSIATALILGIIVNAICSIGRKEKAVSVIDNGVDVDELEASLQAELEEEVAEEETEEATDEELTLKDLDILKEQGLISDEEYEEKKKNLK